MNTESDLLAVLSDIEEVRALKPSTRGIIQYLVELQFRNAILYGDRIKYAVMYCKGVKDIVRTATDFNVDVDHLTDSYCYKHNIDGYEKSLIELSV